MRTGSSNRWYNGSVNVEMPSACLFYFPREETSDTQKDGKENWGKFSYFFLSMRWQMLN